MSKALRRFGAPVPKACLAYLRDTRSHGASQVLAPKYVVRHRLGMTTPNEQAYFEWYTRRIYTGRGAIVDLGCWLGSTTIPLAKGIRRSRRTSGRVIHAYDQFIWETWMAQTAPGGALDPQPNEGESFQAAFERRIAPWEDLVATHAADLCTEIWDGGPIEFLLVDAMKSWELSDAIVRSFYPHVITGGFILHQDFSHYYTPWIHLVTHRLRDYVRPVYDVPGRCSSVFEVVKTMPDAVTNVRYGEIAYDRGEIEAAFDYSLSVVPRNKHPAIAAAKVKAILANEGVGPAWDELRVWESRSPGHFELAQVASLVQQAR